MPKIKSRFSPQERMQMIDEYLRGKSSGMIARTHKCSASYVRSLAFYYLHRWDKQQINLYRNGFVRLSDLQREERL